MRHRYVVNLYSNDHLDAEISDYITIFGGSKKQELLRTLLRVGYSSLIKHKSNPASIISGFSTEELVAVISLLSANGIIPANNANQTQGAVVAPGVAITNPAIGQNGVGGHDVADAKVSSDESSRLQPKTTRTFEITHTESTAKQYTENDIADIADDQEEFIDPLQSFMDIPNG